MVYLITVIPLLAQNNLIGDQGLINNMHSTDSTEAPPWRPWVKTYVPFLRQRVYWSSPFQSYQMYLLQKINKHLLSFL